MLCIFSFHDKLVFELFIQSSIFYAPIPSRSLALGFSISFAMPPKPLESVKSFPRPSYKQWLQIFWQDILILLMLGAVALGVSARSTKRRGRVMLTEDSRFSMWNRNLQDFFPFRTSIASHTPTVKKSFRLRPVQRLPVGYLY